MPSSFCCCELVGGLAPIDRRRGRRLDPELEQPDAAELRVVAHHADVAREPGRRARSTLLGSRPSASVALRAVGDAGEPGLPGDRVPVAGVVGGILHRVARVRRKFGSSDWSRGISHLLSISWDSWAPFVSTIRSQPVGLPGELRPDLRVEGVVVVDDRPVVHLDAGLLREEIQARVLPLWVSM